MRDAAGAAKMSADVANRSLLILERSRITVSKFTAIETDGGIRFRYVVEVLNTGRIPASIYERQFTFYPTDAPLPEIPPEEGAPIQGLATIGPSQSMQFRSTESHPLPTGQTVYVIGVFRYRDDLGDSRETRFCAEYFRSEKITWMVDKPGYNIAT